jgi:CRP-like cAMP-binding protein
MSTTEIPRDLGRLIAFALPGSRSETSQFLAETARVRRFAAEDAIFRQGEPIPLTYIVRGHGAFRRMTIDGQLLGLGIAEPGGLYGFTSVSATIAAADMVALTECEVAIWKGPDVRRLVEADAGFALDVIDRLSLYVTMITEKVDGFLHQDARRRVIRVLVRHRDLLFGDPPVLSRSHLPALVGTSREMTGRVLRQLEREGTVARVGRNGLRLLRPERLDADESPRDLRGRAVL